MLCIMAHHCYAECHLCWMTFCWMPILLIPSTDQLNIDFELDHKSHFKLHCWKKEMKRRVFTLNNLLLGKVFLTFSHNATNLKLKKIIYRTIEFEFELDQKVISKLTSERKRCDGRYLPWTNYASLFEWWINLHC
jgi:hypothetical protein